MKHIKKQFSNLWGLLIVIPLIFSCTSPTLPCIDGMWQLKTVENTDGKHPVDTIFYSFQYQRIFSVTILNADHIKSWNSGDPTVVIYGYTHFTADNQLTLDINKPEDVYQAESPENNYRKDDYWKFIPWATPDRTKSSATLTIKKQTSKELVLKQEDTNSTYSFIKF